MDIADKILKRYAEADPVAVVDIGSNSVRLVVYEGGLRSPSPLYNEKISCGLGRQLATTKMLARDSVERALKALVRFNSLAKQIGAKKLNVIATAAAREATNGPEFITNAEQACGAKIDVLSGENEARLAANGVIAGVHNADGLAGDLGGGSLELIDVRNQKLIGGTTLPVGSLRLADLSGGDMTQAASFIDEQLSSVEWLRKQGEGRPFYAVGGTWRAFAKLHMEQTGYPLRVIHGYSMSTDEALKFAHLVDHISPQSLDGFDKFSESRQLTVPYGALVLEDFIKKVSPSKIQFSAFGVREGLLYELMAKNERRQDPLLSACGQLAVHRSRSVEHAYELCDWTDQIFDEEVINETEEEQRLRHAACLLSDIGWRAHPDYRGLQSLNLVAYGSFSGIGHPGRAYLAATIYYRHEGLVDANVSPDIFRLMDDRMTKRARILGRAIRAGHMLSAAMPHIIDQTVVRYTETKMILYIPAELSYLYGERLDKRFKKLAEEFDLDFQMRIGKKGKKGIERAREIRASRWF